MRVHKLVNAAVDDIADKAYFAHVDHQGNHDLGAGVEALFAGFEGRADDGANLHFGDLGIDHGQAAAAKTEHRIDLGQIRARLPDRLGALAQVFGQRFDIAALMGQKLVQRRVEQANGDRQAVHDPKQFEHVLVLEHLQRRQVFFALSARGGQNHGAHVIDALGGKKHMLGAAQADALGAEFAGLGRVFRRFRVGAHLQPAVFVRPGQQGLKVLRGRGLDLGNVPEHHLARGAVQGEHIAAADRRALGGHGDPAGGVHAQAAAAGDGAHAHAAGHHGGVRGHTA